MDGQVPIWDRIKRNQGFVATTRSPSFSFDETQPGSKKERSPPVLVGF